MNPRGALRPIHARMRRPGLACLLSANSSPTSSSTLSANRLFGRLQDSLWQDTSPGTLGRLEQTGRTFGPFMPCAMWCDVPPNAVYTLSISLSSWHPGIPCHTRPGTPSCRSDTLLDYPNSDFCSVKELTIMTSGAYQWLIGFQQARDVIVGPRGYQPA